MKRAVIIAIAFITILSVVVLAEDPGAAMLPDTGMPSPSDASAAPALPADANAAPALPDDSNAAPALPADSNAAPALPLCRQTLIRLCRTQILFPVQTARRLLT
jgi:hypothetical protein